MRTFLFFILAFLNFTLVSAEAESFFVERPGIHCKITRRDLPGFMMDQQMVFNLGVATVKIETRHRSLSIQTMRSSIETIKCTVFYPDLNDSGNERCLREVKEQYMSAEGFFQDGKLKMKSYSSSFPETSSMPAVGKLLVEDAYTVFRDLDAYSYEMIDDWDVEALQRCVYAANFKCFERTYDQAVLGGKNFKCGNAITSLKIEKKPDSTVLIIKTVSGELSFTTVRKEADNFEFEISVMDRTGSMRASGIHDVPTDLSQLMRNPISGYKGIGIIGPTKKEISIYTRSGCSLLRRCVELSFQLPFSEDQVGYLLRKNKLDMFFSYSLESYLSGYLSGIDLY